MAKKRLLTLAIAALLVLSAAPSAAAADADPAADYYQLTNSWVYTLVHEVKVYNAASSYAFNIEVKVPLLDTALPVYNQLIGEQFTPYPDRLETDAAGHLYAVYNIGSLKGKDSLTLTQKYALNVAALSYSFDRNRVADTYSSQDIVNYSQYLQPETDVESNAAEIVAFVEQAVGSETNPYRKAWALFSAVNLFLTYSEAATDQGALATLTRGSGNCEGYTNLYLACLRTAGIPARRINGYLYQPEKHAVDSYYDEDMQLWLLNSLGHTWVEYYLPDIGWLIADPTFTYTYDIGGVTQKIIDPSFFTNISSSRRYIAFSIGNANSGKIGSGAIGGAIEISAIGGAVGGTFNAYLATGKQYLPFNDLEGHWAGAAVRDCVEDGLFYGVSADRFAPDMGMTRAMFVTVLGRYYQQNGGEIGGGYDSIDQFTDIDPSAYYADYLGWALDNELIEGYGYGRFGPKDIITREQMATILADFILLLQREAGMEIDEDAAVLPVLSAYSDAAKIAGWAREGVALCSQLSVITGEPDGGFYPQRSATRAQVATILQRLPAY